MANDLSRRAFLAISAAFAAVPMTVSSVGAFSVEEARALIDKLVAEINGVIGSGKPESAMIKDFESIFVRYADVPTIAVSALGPAGRGAPKAVVASYAKAFQGYIARKYGKRFREFIGGSVEVTGARPLKSYFEVVSVAKLKGQAPFEVRWQVSDKSGRTLFFNLIIEGVNMLATEREEIGAMLDREGGDIGRLTAALQTAG